MFSPPQDDGDQHRNDPYSDLIDQLTEQELKRRACELGLPDIATRAMINTLGRERARQRRAAEL